MNLHEYQSKQLFARYAIPVPLGEAGLPHRSAPQAVPDLPCRVWCAAQEASRRKALLKRLTPIDIVAAPGEHGRARFTLHGPGEPAAQKLSTLLRVLTGLGPVEGTSSAPSAPR